MLDYDTYFYIRDDIHIKSLSGKNLAASFYYPLSKEVSFF